MSLNVAVIVREAALAAPDKPVAIFPGGRLTYGELDALSDRVAATLAADGVGPGEAVGLMMPNVPHFLVAYFGILKAGCVVVPMNVLLKAPEVAYYLADSDARALVTWVDMVGEAAKGAADAGVTALYAAAPPGRETPDGVLPFEALLTADPPGPLMEPRGGDDTAVRLYTSGTTGRPKGAELSHFQLFMNCDTAGRLFGMSPDDTVLTVLPLFHVFGLSSVLNVCVRFGGTMSLVPRFDAATVLETIQRDRCTIFEGVPTMYIGLLHHPELASFDTSTLRIAISGGAAIPAEVIDTFEDRFGVVILEGYGLSETASTCTFNISASERKVYSIGKRLWGVEVGIVDDDMNELPAGRDHVGELVVRGHNVTKGYYKRPEETAEAFRGGWFHTGDLGYVDDEGFFFIVDRKKELIIRGGYNVYPREVEEVLYQHPAVAEAAVIGVVDDRLGEEVAAVVALRPGQQVDEPELIAFMRERVAAYKYPRTIRFLDTLPKGPTGKILKRELQ